MKKILILLILMIVNQSFAQKYDDRLVKNHGDKIASIFTENHNYYNFLLFELDNCYEFRTLSNDFIGLKLNQLSDFKNAKGKTLTKADFVVGQFNFKEWGIVLNQDKPVVIQLDEKNVVFFYDKISNNKRFASSPLNTK
jgi:hypothetical protein